MGVRKLGQLKNPPYLPRLGNLIAILSTAESNKKLNVNPKSGRTICKIIA
jgi:hypothetical protein